jgi:hypothetical protein
VTTRLLLLAVFVLVSHTAHADERGELDSIIIKGNKEFPQILYIVPWKDMKAKGHQEQTLVLHSLSDDLFRPVYQDAIGKDHPPTIRKK